MTKIKFSVIIPVRKINNYILNFTPKILAQDFSDFEVIILPNEKPEKNPFKDKRVKIIASGNVGPAQKRDRGAKISKGEILAFIDDDAYPEKNWLKQAIEEFKDNKIVAVGGPNLTPKESNFFQKVSGDILSSYLASGPVAYRYKPLSRREVNDFPSCNLLVRKKEFLKIGGFDTSFWPGEDTKLCLDLKKQGGKIVYSPNLLVYHHRRENLKDYVKQIFSYSVHRGYFAKKYPETSLKISYFIPALFVMGLFLGGIMAYFSEILRLGYLSVLGLYGLLILIEAVKTKRFLRGIIFIPLIFITHLVYGIGLMRGIFKKDLKSKYRS